MTGPRFVGPGAGGEIPATVDVLVVGSGPVGSTFARRIADLAPRARVLIVEAGPRLTERAGMHTRNIADEHAREFARRRAAGIGAAGTFTASTPGAGGLGSQRDADVPQSQPGTFFVDPNAAREGRDGTLPSAAMSCNVGGMGAHWAGATPFPRGRERIGFIAADEWERDLAVARRLLAVSVAPPRSTPAWTRMLAAVRPEFSAELPDGEAGIQGMPLGCRARVNGDAPYWTGCDVILGDLALAPRETFAIAADTMCRELLTDDDRVRGGVLEHRISGETVRVLANAVVVAGDSLRTPQLLWASGVRPRALGHHLNDHAMVGGAFVPGYLDAPEDPAGFMGRLLGSTTGLVANTGWAPYCDDRHPLHGQFGQMEESPLGGRKRPVGLIYWSYMVPKEIRFEDRVRFLDDELDPYGMPAIAIDYSATDHDLAAVEQAKSFVTRAALAVGADDPPAVLQPGGTSLHYMGTVRMGENDDGESVCDSHSRVWGFQNLFVGGNGVIPTSTACNPTLTSVALATRAATAATATATCRETALV